MVEKNGKKMLFLLTHDDVDKLTELKEKMHTSNYSETVRILIRKNAEEVLA